MSKTSAITSVIIDLAYARERCAAGCSCGFPCYKNILPFLSQLVRSFGLDESVLYDESAIINECIDSCMRLVIGFAKYASQVSGIPVMFIDSSQAQKNGEENITGDGDGEEKSV